MSVRAASKIDKKRRVKKLKDLNAPKAPLTPYLKWGQEQRKKDSSLKNMSLGDQGKKLSEMWKHLSEDNKEKLKLEYQTEKTAYMEKLEEYKKTDDYKEWAKQKDALTQSDKKGKKQRKKRSSQSAYNIYFKEQYPILGVKKEGEEKPQMKDVASAIAKNWKALSETEKAHYQNEADTINNGKKELEPVKEEISVESEELEDDPTDEEVPSVSKKKQHFTSKKYKFEKTITPPMNKAPKQNTGKAPISTQQNNDLDKKKKKKMSNLCSGMQFRSAIKRIAKDVNPDSSVFLTSQAIAILCAIAYDIVSSCGEVASEFSKKVSKQTVGADEVVAAFEILLKGELKKLALREVHSCLSKPNVPSGRAMKSTKD